MSRPSQPIITTELGLERRCAQCEEYWPMDKEFFNLLKDGRWHSYCRSCMTARRRELRAGAPRKIKKYQRSRGGINADPDTISDEKEERTFRNLL